jgi:hypothetical protein
MMMSVTAQLRSGLGHRRCRSRRVRHWWSTT